MAFFGSGRLVAGSTACECGVHPAAVAVAAHARIGRAAALRRDLGMPASGAGAAWRAVSYLSAFDPTNGPSDILEQMHETDAASAAMPSLLMKRFVDSGSEIGRDGAGAALRDLARLAATGGFDVLFVQHVSRFATDYAVALGLAVDIAGMGIRIVETRGCPVPFTAAEVAPLRGMRS